MTSIRRAHPNDLFAINTINCDTLTETFPIHYYLRYLITWPSCFYVTEEPKLVRLSEHAIATPSNPNSENENAQLNTTTTATPTLSAFTNAQALPRMSSIPSDRCLSGYSMFHTFTSVYLYTDGEIRSTIVSFHKCYTFGRRLS